jgi:transposase
MRGIWRRLFEALARADPGEGQAIDTTAKPTARRRAEKGSGNAGDRPLARRQHHENPRHRRLARTPIAIEVTPGQFGDVRVALTLVSAVPQGRLLVGDVGYDSDGLRRFLLQRGTVPVIPNNPTRKTLHAFDHGACRQINLIERMPSHLKGRASQPAMTSSQPTSPRPIMLAAVIIWWT